MNNQFVLLHHLLEFLKRWSQYIQYLAADIMISQVALVNQTPFLKPLLLIMKLQALIIKLTKLLLLMLQVKHSNVFIILTSISFCPTVNIHKNSEFQLLLFLLKHLFTTMCIHQGNHYTTSLLPKNQNIHLSYALSSNSFLSPISVTQHILLQTPASKVVLYHFSYD